MFCVENNTEQMRIDPRMSISVSCSQSCTSELQIRFNCKESVFLLYKVPLRYRVFSSKMRNTVLFQDCKHLGYFAFA
jgi:hypothetical protein